jgi:cyanophycin synthetase
MILTPDILYDQETVNFLFPNARAWQSETLRKELVPLIGVAGTRGKSTVLRLIESVLTAMRFKTATWTDMGVQIRGRNQRAELAGWGRALQGLVEGNLDVGLQELDWAAVSVAGLPTDMYPVMVHTGLRETSEPVGNSSRFQIGLGSTVKCIAATHHDGIVVANGDDYFVVDALEDTDASVILVSQSIESPNMKAHLASNGSGVWVKNGVIYVGTAARAARFGNVREFPITFDGEASFNVKNVLLALGALHAIGVDLPLIRKQFRQFRAAWDILPASMNLYNYHDARVVIDQLAPHWILRDVLKVLNPGMNRRQITVAGDLSWIEPDEVYDVGKLLGRYRGAIVLHGDQEPDRLADFKRGLASNEYPPLLSILPTERRAINRAFESVRPNNVLVILTTRDSGPTHRAIRRHLEKA